MTKWPFSSNRVSRQEAIDFIAKFAYPVDPQPVARKRVRERIRYWERKDTRLFELDIAQSEFWHCAREAWPELDSVIEVQQGSPK